MVASTLFAVGLTLSAALLPASNAFNMADKGDFTLFDAPISTDAPPADEFPYNDGLKTWLPPRFLAPDVVGSMAIPTNNWWGNLIANFSNATVQSVWTNPYVFRPVLDEIPFGLSVDYPYPDRVFEGNTTFGNKTYYSLLSTDVTMSAAEFLVPPMFQVTSWDDLGVSTSFTAESGGTIAATLVPGMAIVTANYTKLTPKIISTSPITAINGKPVTPVVYGKRFVLDLASGLQWVLYSDSDTTLLFDGHMSLVGEPLFTGHIRLALVVGDAQLAALDKSASCLLEGSNIEAKDATDYMFHLKTSGDCSGGLFHYLQVHHMDTLDRSSAVEVASSTAYSAARGPMTGVLTTTNPPVIRFTETQNVPVEFYPPRKPRPDIVVNQNIKKHLINDIVNATWQIPINGSYYFNGKAAHKYANLCLMANDEAIVESDKNELLRICLDKLENLLLPFATNTWTYPLNYDTTYRGIISPLGLLLNDVNADFGNTMYNDHHYHFGYWIATSAIVNLLDPHWSYLSQLNRVTTFLIRDVVNPSVKDPHFPKFRSLDWFRGHSYSHGVTAVPDGKDEESSSEDINFHYAVALFGKVTGNKALFTIGQLMLKLNTHAVQNYFLMTNDNRVHPPSIVVNKVPGIMWDNKLSYTTWFTPKTYGIHGIQMIPITPVTEYVRTAKFVAEEWDEIVSKIDDVVTTKPTRTWLSLIYANYATVNMKLALEKLQFVALDDGITRSWALYMAASSASTITPPDTTPLPTTPTPTTSTPTAPTPTTPTSTAPVSSASSMDGSASSSVTM